MFAQNLSKKNLKNFIPKTPTNVKMQAAEAAKIVAPWGYTIIV